MASETNDTMCECGHPETAHNRVVGADRRCNACRCDYYWPGEHRTPYVASENIDPALREELREWQTAGAHTFLRFEASLPDNPASPDPVRSGEARQPGILDEGTRVELLGREYVWTNRGYGEANWYLRYDDHTGRIVDRSDELSHALTLIARQQSALDALATAVVQVEQIVWNAGAGATDDTYAVTFQARELRPLLSAISSLLSTRGTT